MRDVVRRTHTDGKVCYSFHYMHRLERCVVMEVDGKEFTAGYMPYTNCWYVQDKDGVEVATVKPAAFEAIFRQHVWAKLQTAPKGEC